MKAQDWMVMQACALHGRHVGRGSLLLVLLVLAACWPGAPAPAATPGATPAAQETARSLANLVDL